MKKVVWYLHHYAGSPELGMSFRPYYLAKSLREFDCEAIVIGASWHHLLRKPRQLSRPILKETIDDVSYLWVNTPPYQGNGFGRIINMLTYSYRLWNLKSAEKIDIPIPDAIIVSSAHPFHFFSGKKIAKKYRAKLIFEVRDIWPLSLIKLLGMNKKNPLAIILTWLEKIAYTHSDAVVSLLVNGLQHMQPRGLSPEKFKYIPNGISLKTDKGEKSIIQDDLQQIKNEGNFLVLYTGAHGVPNALENLILSAKYLAEQKNENVKFILIGDGKEKNRLKNIVNEFGLNNVQFFDPIPKSQVHNILQIADACYIGAQKTNLYKFGVSPNKLFDYMLAEKPVIFAIDSPNNPVSLSQGGVCVAPNNPLSLTNEILRLTKLPKDELKNMGLKGRQYVLKNHDYSVLANKYLELF